jgi:hypothetical protein
MQWSGKGSQAVSHDAHAAHVARRPPLFQGEDLRGGP